MLTTRYAVTKRQLEQLKTIVEKLKIDGLKAAIKSADEMSTYLEMHAETPEEKGLYESYLETWDNSHMQLEDIAENARELKYLAEDIENQPLEDTAIDKASYMFRRAETAELEAIARKWAEYFDADITIRRDNQGKNIDKKVSLAEAEIGMIYAYLVALTRTCAEDEEDGGPSISEMIAIILFCAANHIKRKDLSEADYDVLFRGLDEYFRSLDHAR